MDGMSGRSHAFPQGIRDTNYFLSLAGILAAMSPMLILLFLGGDLVTRKGVMVAYVETVSFLFAAFIVLFLLSQWIQKKGTEPADSLPAAYVTLIVPAECVLITLTVVNILPLAEYIWAILSAHLIFIVLWWFGRKKMMASTFMGDMNKRVIQLLPVLAAGIFWVWFYIGRSMLLPGWREFLLLVLGVAALAVYLRCRSLWNFLPTIRNYWWFYLVLLLALVGLVYQPALPFDRIHAGFFLAPVNDVLKGKWVFIDTTSQYGVGLIYALAAVFRVLRLPLSYAGFSFVVDVLFILQYAVLFLILRRATGSLPLSLAGIGAVLYFNFLANVWPSMLRIPAQSPLRYGMIYLLLAVALSGVRRKKNILGFLEWALIGIASLWSMETFAFVLFSVDAFHFVADILYAERIRDGVLTFGKRIALQAGAILAAWGLWMAASFFTTGSLPSFVYFADTLSNYTVTEQYSHTIDFRSFGLAGMTAVYLLSILAVLFLRWKRRNLLPVEMASLLAAFSVSGVLQNLYYFVYEIDFHLALICVPLILVLALWLAVILHEPAGGKILAGAKASFGLAVLVSVWICAVYSSPNFIVKFRQSFLFVLADAATTGERIRAVNPYQIQPSNDSVEALMTLIGRYAPEDEKLAVFARNDDEIESLLLTGKTHLLDIANPLMCSNSPSYSAYILDRAAEYSGSPEYIFYDSGEDALIDLQREALRILLTGATYQVIDQIGDIVVLKKAFP
jgi:hypothetical protein